jgi:hypothetical protein
MASDWPENPDDKVDEALRPVIEAGGGESEGFELAEQDLIEHAEHGDEHGTSRITQDAAGFDTPEDAEVELDEEIYAESDDAEPEDL